MYAKRFSQGHWTSLGPGDEKKWYGSCNYKLEGKWNSVASQMMQRFKDTSHPVLPSASALSREILRKVKGRETIHFNADASNTELFFRIIHSVNQLSMYGVVSNWCEEFGPRPKKREPTWEKFAEENSVSKEIPKGVNSPEVNSSVCAPRTQPASGIRWRESLQNFELQSNTRQLENSHHSGAR